MIGCQKSIGQNHANHRSIHYNSIYIIIKTGTIKLCHLKMYE